MQIDTLIKKFGAFPQTFKVYDEQALCEGEIVIREFARTIDPYDGLYRYFETCYGTDEQGYDMDEIFGEWWDVAEIATRDGRIMYSAPAPKIEEE